MIVATVARRSTPGRAQRGYSPSAQRGCRPSAQPGYSPLKHQGFTLVEVMFALGIFALAALAAVTATSQHLNNLNYMQDKSLAQYAGANALARISLNYPPENNATGVEIVGGKQWHWRVQVLETQTADVFYVTVRVFDSAEMPADGSGALVVLSRYLGANT